MADHQLAHSAMIAKYGSNFAVSARTFNVSAAEEVVINDWYNSLKPEILAIQNASTSSSSNSTLTKDEPYYGAIGGGLSYCFTPTGLGNLVSVTESITGKTLNVSDALGWYFFG